MADRKIVVETHIVQVVDGRQYKGYLEIFGSRMDYEIIFGDQIPRLRHVYEEYRDDKLRRTFAITLQRGGVNIELSLREYLFFVAIIGKMSMEFFGLEETRYMNRQSAREPFDAVEAFCSRNATASLFLDLGQKTCDMLSHPKFGCTVPPAD